MTSIRRAARRGFTLIELMVVIAIIAILMSLVVGGVMRILLLQQSKTTKDELTKLETARTAAYTQVLDTAKNESPCPLALTWSNGNPDLARVLHIKLRLRQEFPQSFAEVQNPVGLPAKRNYVQAIQNAQAGHSAFEQSSILLYLSLKESRRGGEFDPDSSLAPQELRTTADNLKVIVDPYGNPIVFIRWPALPNLDPAVVAALPALSTSLTTVVKSPPLPIDAEDPEGLMTAAWFASANGQQFTQFCHGPPVIGTTYYPMRPLIASTGVNGKLGDSDDFYSLNLVLGGTK